MTEVRIPDASNWINALEAGKRSGMADQADKAKRQAGGLMASGDYKGAAQALYSTGDLATGSAVANAGANQAASDLKLSRAAKVSEKLHAGDYAGAYAEAGTDSDLLTALDKVSAHAKETNGILASSLQGLKGKPYPEAKALYDTQIKPALLARKIFAPEQLDAFDPTPENITAMESQVLGLEKSLEMAKPDYHEVKNADTSTRFVDLNPRNRTAEPAAPAPGPAAAPAPDAPIPTGGMYATIGQIAATKGAKPEEVGYLQRLAHVESHGDPSAQNGSSKGLFQFHPDTFAGAGGGNIHDAGDQTAAALNLSRRDRANLQELGIEPTDANVYIMHQQGPGGGRALLTAPPEVGAVAVLTPVYGNPKRAEQAIVGNGGTPDMTAGDFVGMWRQRWANGGKPVDAHQPAATPQVQAQPQGGPPGIAGSAAQPTEWHSDGKGNLINTRTGDRKVDTTAGADAIANPDLVKMIIEGRAPVPTANRAATDPKWQAAMAEAMAQDPSLDAANYGTRVKTRADFATGTAAKTKTALNTALGHAGDLDAQVDALGNTPIRMVNKAGNYLKSETGDPHVKTFNLTKEALLHEAMKVFSGSQGSLQEFTLLSENLNVNDSPAQQHSVIRKLVGLLASKMDALGEQYKTGMGKELDQSQIMSRHAQDVFNKISGLPGESGHAAPTTPAAPANPAAPRPTATLKTDPAAISEGKAAIAKGADRAAVIARLREHGIDPAGI